MVGAAAREDVGVVHQGVDVAEGAARCVTQRAEICVIGDLRVDCDRFDDDVGDPIDRRLRRCIVRVGDDDFSPSAAPESAAPLPKIDEWRKEDAVYRGGRPRVLSDRAILIACMLLRADESPMHITGMANIFRFRLDDDARTWLGLDHVEDTGVLEQDQVRWLNRTWRSFHNILDTMDAWPGPENCSTEKSESSCSACANATTPAASKNASTGSATPCSK